jgi:hypothetical protein
MTRRWILVGLLVVGCGDKTEPGTPDGPDAPSIDAAIDATVDSPPGFCPPDLVSSWSGDSVFTDSESLNDGTQVGTVTFGTGMVGKGSRSRRAAGVTSRSQTRPRSPSPPRSPSRAGST